MPQDLLSRLPEAMALRPGATAGEILRVLHKSPDRGALRSFPTILIEKPRPSHRWSEAGSHTAADSAVNWYRAKGLAADRTRMSGNGYPGLLQELRSPPPWIEVQMEDVLGAIPPEREQELRPLLDQYKEYGHESILTRFDSDREARSRLITMFLPESSDSDAEASVISEAVLRIAFEEVLALGAAIGTEMFEAVWESVFDSFGDILPAPGTPDLLVWHPEGVPGAWFFSEVKGPGDAFQESQKTWLRTHSDLLNGHFLLTMLE